MVRGGVAIGYGFISRRPGRVGVSLGDQGEWVCL